MKINTFITTTKTLDLKVISGKCKADFTKSFYYSTTQGDIAHSYFCHIIYRVANGGLEREQRR
jgi:hypothetical protein